MLADDVVDDEERAAADEDADERVKQKVLNLFFGQAEAPAAGRAAHPEIDANERHQVGDAVPMDFERAEMDRDGVDICRIAEPVMHSYRPYSDDGITISGA